MQINRNKFVVLTYELRTEGFDSEVLEVAGEDNPLSFVYGTGLMLPKFEENILGLLAGADYKFSLKSDEAYGPSLQDRIVDLPKEMFMVDGVLDEEMLTVGNVLPMMDSQNNRLNGKVVALEENAVVMDFNHPMAGKDLYFIGKIVEVRDASEDEIAQVAAMLSGEAGGCGGGCGCGDSCGDGCGDGACETEAENGGGCGCGCGCN